MNPRLLLAVAVFALAIHPTKTTFIYWFSLEQKTAIVHADQANPAGQDAYIPLYVTVNGKPVEYTECQPQKVGRPFGRFNDYKQVALTSSGPCSPSKGQR